jgi:hypothetical protein
MIIYKVEASGKDTFMALLIKDFLILIISLKRIRSSSESLCASSVTLGVKNI